MGQCSPAVEQNLEAEEVFEEFENKSNSIELIKLLEKLCYSYRAHEYTPLGAWNAFDKLGELKQPEHVHEVKHYETFRSVVEMCKASSINFALMCTANIDMAMKELGKSSKIKKTGTFSDGTYFTLDDADRNLVDKMAEEICLSTRFLSLSSDAIHSGSKQELANDMVKGEDKYPRTMASTLRFLQYHNLRGNNSFIPKKDPTKTPTKAELAFANTGEKGDAPRDDAEKDEETKANKVSSICGKFRDGVCPYKKRHTWKECPSNKWGINYKKELDAAGDSILCQLSEYSGALEDEKDAALFDRSYGSEGEEVENKDNDNNNDVTVYSPLQNTCLTLLDGDNELMFIQEHLSDRIVLSQYKHVIDEWWVLLDNQSTVNLFKNAGMLKNIREVQGHVTVHCNAGNITVNMMGDLPGFGPVWYYPNAIANILSMFLVAQRFHVQYDSRTSGSFKVWKDDDTCRNFTPGPKGQYYSDFKDRHETILVTNDQPRP